MELVKCPICGEMYSDSYKACPFCAESGPYEGTVKRRRMPGRRVEKRRGPKIVGPAMIVVLLLLAAILVFAFYGDKIKDAIRHGDEEKPPVVVQLSVEPATAELAVGEIRALTASGAGRYLWSSSDETVATVDEQGTVTAVAPGTAVITVTNAAKDESAQCQVTVQDVTVDPENPGTDDPGTDDPGTDDPEGPSDPGKKLTMCALWNGQELPTITIDGETMYDVTLSRGSTTLYISGTDSTVTWSSDTSAVTVNEKGLITRVSRGTAIITASVDGQTLKCRVLG